jgi:universal stress protein E
MINYKQLLVVIDPEHETQAALARACLIAQATHAKIKVVMCIYDFSYEMTTMLSVDERNAMKSAVIKERTQWLSKVIAPYQDSVSDTNIISYDVIWDNRSHEAFIKTGVANQSDLIIKATKSHEGLASLIFTPTDWHLLRKAPFPVLLVKPHDWPNNGNIIAAVNIGTDDQQHNKLNTKIANEAKKLCGIIGC